MAEEEPSAYGQHSAAFYDTWIAPAVAGMTEASVDFLADIAAGGRALELGIGTARVALPLAARRGHGPRQRLRTTLTLR